MNIAQPFIERPIATSLLTVGLILLGLLGYRFLPVASLPSVDLPTIQVTVNLPGAGPETLAATVTAPLEYALGSITGLTSITSTSTRDRVGITLQFALNHPIETAAQDVQAAISTASGDLPRSLPYPPTYAKVNPADTPIMTIGLTARNLSARKVHEFAQSLVAQKLSQVEGVGLVVLSGGQKPAVRVQVNPAALAGVGLTLEDVRGTVAQATVNLPKGSLDGARQAYAIGTDDQLFSAEGYRALVIAYKSGAPVRLGDVATVIDGVENRYAAAFVGDEPALILEIRRQPGANIVETVDRVNRLLPKLREALPPAMSLEVLVDRTTSIRAAIHDVQQTMLITAALVVMVIFLFLRRLWATVIPSVSLPVSLVTTFAVMALAGDSLDNLSLMALTISAGFVVDDAIVMIENIVRHLEMGKSPRQAALDGAREIGFTVVSLTVSLVAVFLPLLLMTGVVGRLFREFAVTLSVAVVISAVISLTLTPMMCAQLLRAGKPAKPESNGAFFSRVLAGYTGSLRWVLRHQALAMGVTLATLAASVWLYIDIPKGFLPQSDTNLIIGVTDAAPDASFAILAERQKAVVAIVRRDPDVTGVTSFLGPGADTTTPNSGRLLITLKPRGERSDRVEAVIARLTKATAAVPGIQLFAQAAQDIQIDSRSARTRYQYSLQDTDAAALAAAVPPLVAGLQKEPALADVASDQQIGAVGALVRIDRDAAARFGILPQAIDDTLYDAFGQRQIATLFTDLNQYRVVLEVAPSFQSDPASLGELRVRARDGQTVRLGAFAQITTGPTPLAVTHVGQFPAATVSFNLAPGHSLGEAVEAINRVSATVGLPATVQTSFSGAAAEFAKSLGDELVLIAAAVITVYIVLGVLYESYIHPITILSTLPSAGVGALLALRLFGYDLSVISLIGIVLLIGIVKKNAIMMIDFARVAEAKRGLAPLAAITEACLLRFRPIMMTTCAAILGALPLAIGQGEGSDLRRPLGVAIVGGLLVSQFLTLYSTPVVYLALGRLGRRRASPAPAPSAAGLAPQPAGE